VTGHDGEALIADLMKWLAHELDGNAASQPGALVSAGGDNSYQDLRPQLLGVAALLTGGAAEAQDVLHHVAEASWPIRDRLGDRLATELTRAVVDEVRRRANR
jgi:hypothetical protein